MTENEYSEDAVSASSVESGSETANTGWTIGQASVNALDLSDGKQLIFVHIEASCSAPGLGQNAAPSEVTALGASFWPAVDWHSQNGKFTIQASNGQVIYLGSTASGVVDAVCEGFYDPWGRS